RKLVTEINVYCYKPKIKLEAMIASQSEWLKESLITDPEYDEPDYRKFVDLFEDYSPKDKTRNTIAVDILSDVARYYRRLIK
ncbi:MAG: hypothetical protein LBQ68_05285, partial [Clostridiales bacterium]|nr:hypothetical protein [Clostridiales bacterium]